MDATISCEDRVTLAYHQMQEATLVHDDAERAPLIAIAELIMAGREIFRLEQIDRSPEGKVKRLFLLTKSKYTQVFRISYESLSLTTMTDMRFL